MIVEGLLRAEQHGRVDGVGARPRSHAGTGLSRLVGDESLVCVHGGCERGVLASAEPQHLEPFGPLARRAGVQQQRALVVLRRVQMQLEIDAVQLVWIQQREMNRPDVLRPKLGPDICGRQ